MGVDPLLIELVAERRTTVTGNYVARGAVDLAVRDLIGEALAVPLHTPLREVADDASLALAFPRRFRGVGGPLALG